MKNTKRILLSRQRHEIVVIRSQKTITMHCGQCSIESDFTSLDAAVDLLRIGTRQVLARIEMGKIHATETLTGQLLVCVRSLESRSF